jgi:hypothetical protein
MMELLDTYLAGKEERKRLCSNHQWISITEKLPDFDNTYFGGDIEEFVNIKIQDSFDNRLYVVPAVFKYNSETFVYDDSMFPNCTVIAWQPLPEV